MSNLALYDIVHTPGVAADLSHIDTQSSTHGFIGADQMAAALKGKLIANKNHTCIVHWLVYILVFYTIYVCRIFW